MFGMGWSELILIGVIALIVVGPKDLPNMFRTMGQFTGKARAMAREFSRAMESAADDAGVKDIQKTVRAAANPSSFGMDKVRDATKSAFKPEDRGFVKTDDGKLPSNGRDDSDKIAGTAAAAADRADADADKAGTDTGEQAEPDQEQPDPAPQEPAPESREK